LRSTKLLLATSNPGKRDEFAALLPSSVTLILLSDVGLATPEEHGTTLAENAALKATTAAYLSGLLAVADDSGLEVDALNGAPGVYSARYAGPNASDAENRLLLRKSLASTPIETRTARFRCSVALATPEGLIAQVEGVCEGRIALVERGLGGFGYDPLFLLDDGRTMAELCYAEKNTISHRGTALRALAPHLSTALARSLDVKRQ